MTLNIDCCASNLTSALLAVAGQLERGVRPHFFLGQKTYAAIAAPIPATMRSQVPSRRLRLVMVVAGGDDACVLGEGD